MNRRLLACFIAGAAFILRTGSAYAQVAVPPPPTTGWVVDQLDIVSSEQEAEINNLVNNLDKDLRVQIAVVVMDDCGDDPTFMRGVIFDNWGIGHDDFDKGLLILACMYGDDPSRRTLSQEVGYGLEGDIPDITTARVRDEYYAPHARTGQVGEGILAMVRYYDGHLRSTHVPTEKEEAQSTEAAKVLIVIFVIFLLLALVIALLAARPSSSGGGRGHRRSSGGYDGGGSDFDIAPIVGALLEGAVDVAASFAGDGGDSGGGGSDGGW